MEKAQTIVLAWSRSEPAANCKFQYGGYSTALGLKLGSAVQASPGEIIRVVKVCDSHVTAAELKSEAS